MKQRQRKAFVMHRQHIDRLVRKVALRVVINGVEQTINSMVIRVFQRHEDTKRMIYQAMIDNFSTT